MTLYQLDLTALVGALWFKVKKARAFGNIYLPLRKSVQYVSEIYAAHLGNICITFRNPDRNSAGAISYDLVSV